MIKQVNLTTSDGKSFQANQCDLSTNWVMIHNGTKVISISENKGEKRGTLSTINTIVEADTMEQLKFKAIQLSLLNFDNVLSDYQNKGKFITAG